MVDKKIYGEAIMGYTPKNNNGMGPVAKTPTVNQNVGKTQVAAPGMNVVMKNSLNTPFDTSKVNAVTNWKDSKGNTMTYNPQTKQVTSQPTAQVPAQNSVYTPTYDNKYSNSSKMGIRQFLNNLGFDNNTITFENGVVKVGGRDFIRPTVNEDGTTYADIYSLQRAADDYYKNSGSDNQLVAAANYAAMEGIGAPLQFNNNGTVTVGGIAIPGQVVVDGVAYAPKNSIENALNEYRISAGVQKSGDLYDKYLSDYGSRIERLQDEINNFQYDPESDPAYKAYEKIYTKLGEQAMQDTYGNAAARSGGYGNSAAIASSSQAYNNYMQQLDAIVPQLEQQNYNRKLTELAMYGTPADRFGWLLDTNNQDYDRLINSQLMDYDRRSFDQSYRAGEQDINIRANEEQRAQQLHDQTVALNDIEIQYAGATLDSRVKSALYSALMLGESLEQAMINNEILEGSKEAKILSSILANDMERAQIAAAYAQTDYYKAMASSIPYENAYTESQTKRNAAETEKTRLESEAIEGELSGNSGNNVSINTPVDRGDSDGGNYDLTKFDSFWDSGNNNPFENSDNLIIKMNNKK